MQHTSDHLHFEVASNASTASLAAPRTLSTSSQNRNFCSKNWCRIDRMWAGIVPTRCLCHDLQAYSNAWPMCSFALSFRSMISALATQSGSSHMFRSNLRFIASRQPKRISVCWSAGETRNLGLVHRVGSTMKSGNDLWKGRTGRVTSS